ncbi:ATP-binding protein [Sphaerisporangium corydalis]|uniref:ATP-binding protein n=1 Tax=Sphaerisporangium corydalis TaxID=1441875 RepID=A0ABV9EMA3_9ACTN|nr:ATP-binding protein [Sphaerisporangium corydalis]
MYTLMGPNCLILPPVLSTAGTARRYIRRNLLEMGLEAKIEDAELVVSELVGNAVKANLVLVDGASENPTQGEEGGICLSLSLKSGAIRIEVWDADPAPPITIVPEQDDENGRGLLIVSRIAVGWGTWWPPEGGKIVWCELSLL